jgi:hypothetical protein
MTLEKYMEEEVQNLLEENELLGKNVFYQPSYANKQVLYKKLERYYRKEKRSAFFRSNKRLFNKNDSFTRNCSLYLFNTDYFG